jgi:3alpha(or 20beta)-hydroxysteroid dehydrogenase
MEFVMSERLANKVAIITGGASGIGEATARLFVSEGARVLIADILTERGEGLREELHGSAEYVQLDVTKAADWDSAVGECLRVFGPPNCLVSNAGINLVARIEDTGEAEMLQAFRVNVLGHHLGMQSVLQSMKENGGGSIVVTSSTAGMIGLDRHGAYAASKAGGTALARCAAIELGPFGIRVNSIHPGPIDTPMRKVASGGGMSDEGREARLRALPVGRVGRAEEVAQMILFLASDESSYVTGAQFLVDGGQLAGFKVFD